MARLVVEVPEGGTYTELARYEIKGKRYVGVIPDDPFLVSIEGIITPAAVAVSINGLDVITGETVRGEQTGAMLICRRDREKFRNFPPDGEGRRQELVFSPRFFNNLADGMPVRAVVVEAQRLEWRDGQTKFYDSEEGRRSKHDLVDPKEPVVDSVLCIWWGRLKEMVSRATNKPEVELSRFER